MAFNVLAEYATSPTPLQLALGPINADSQPDLVVLSGNGSVDVRLGSAGGAFGAAQNSATGASRHSIVEGDFTGDGIADLLTANANDLSLLAGNGDGTFQPPQTVSGPSSQSLTSAAAGDLNGDGKLDLAVAGQITTVYCPYYCYTTYDGYANVLLGNGTGGFSAPATTHLGAGRYPIAIAIGDVNGDSDADVVTANTFSSDLSVLLGDGSGVLGNPNHSGGFNQPLPSISLGDVDGDGKVDTLSSYGYGLVVQKGDGLGSFSPMPVVNTGGPVSSAVIGDINADGMLDLVAVGVNNSFICTSYGYYGCYYGYNTFTKQAAVVLGNGLGGFSLPLISHLGSGVGYSNLPDLAIADLTGDGLPELATIDSYASTAIIATNDGDWNPPAGISISDASITEGDSGTLTAVFTVTIVGDHDGVSLDYYTSDYNAAAGADYTAKSGSLSFSASESSKQISITILGDTTDEYDEQFFLNLFNASGGQVTDPTGAGTIVDNDAAPLVTIGDTSKNEGNRNNTPIDFTVTLSQASGKVIYVDYSTADGTAKTADNDYYATNGTLYFSPGTTTATINTSLRGDKRRESNETFSVNLTGVVDATIGDSQGIGTIVNDDGGKLRPSVRISNASLVEGNSGTKLLEFTVSLTSPSDGSVSVDFATKNGTARSSDDDYERVSGRLEFAEGESTKTVSVVIYGDSKREGHEEFFVELSNAREALLLDHLGIGSIMNDDRR